MEGLGSSDAARPPQTCFFPLVHEHGTGAPAGVILDFYPLKDESELLGTSWDEGLNCGMGQPVLRNTLHFLAAAGHEEMPAPGVLWPLWNEAVGGG